MKKYLWPVVIILFSIVLLISCQSGEEQPGEIVKNGISDGQTVDENTSAGEVSSDKEMIANKLKDFYKKNREGGEVNLEEIIAGKNYYLAPFNGQYINEKVLTRAVMVSVENLAAARPQSGLAEADIVYEFLVEGGITRFLPLYWQKIPEKIGPVRSLRPYLIETALSYDALLLHAGASPEGFEMLSEVEVANIDQIYNGNYYWRDRSKRKPHNLYTGYFKFKNYLNNLTGIDYKQRFPFQQIQLLVNEDIKASIISIDYWGNYSVLYRYLPEKNIYERFLYDFNQPHLTEDGRQLTAKNIIIQYVETEVKDDIGRLKMQLAGENKALIFRDGTVINGYWRANENEYTKYYSSDDKEIKLNPGQTWIQIVPVSTEVKYKGSDDSDR